MQTPSLAQPVSKSNASQPGQPLPGVGDVGQVRAEIFFHDALDDRPETAVLSFEAVLVIGTNRSK